VQDTAETRAAAIQYLRNWSINFYPDHSDVFQSAQRLAKELGGTLEVPQLSWKYNWIRQLFGWRSAKRVQVLAPRVRWTLIRSVDQQLSRIEAWRRRDRLAPNQG
jgi:hypothetical protein